MLGPGRSGAVALAADRLFVSLEVPPMRPDAAMIENRKTLNRCRALRLKAMLALSGDASASIASTMPTAAASPPIAAAAASSLDDVPPPIRGSLGRLLASIERGPTAAALAALPGRRRSPPPSPASRPLAASALRAAAALPVSTILRLSTRSTSTLARPRPR